MKPQLAREQQCECSLAQELIITGDFNIMN